MRSKFLLAAGMVLAVCGSASQETPPNLPEPIDPPEPTATPTKLVDTDLPPQPSATNTPQATPTVIPTNTPPLLQINFTPYENNSIVKTGDFCEWDYYRVMGDLVVLTDDTFHLFYDG
jgi:hypothetical protein